MGSVTKRKIKSFLSRNFMHIYGLFHKIKPKILFSSFNGKQYSDNPRAISEKMHELYPEIELVWYLYDVRDPYGIIPDYVRVVTKHSIFFYKELATASCFVTNEAMEENIYKRKGQFFIQTWHGDRAFKKILYDVWDEKGKERPMEIVDGKITDLCIAGSDYGCLVYNSAFCYFGEILCSGSPRNDRLVNSRKEDIEAIKGRLNIDLHTKIMLYAPTFRDSNGNKNQKVELDLNLVIKKLQSKGDDWICLLRAHSCSSGLVDSSLCMDQEHFRDVTDYPDMADLLCVADFLITDYSSCACDFVLTGKPVILYIADKDEYQKSSRSFKADPEEVGFYTATNTEELLHILDTKTQDDFKKSYDRVNSYYGTVETGHATEEICQMIFKLIKDRCGGGELDTLLLRLFLSGEKVCQIAS